MPQYARRARDTDPHVAARLQAISYADPYVFVHADDVIDPEALTYEAFPYDDRSGGGWVPEPPASRRPPPPPAVPGLVPAVPARPGPAPALSLRVRVTALWQRLELAGSGLLALLVLGLLAAAVAVVLLVRAQPRSTSLSLPSQTAAARTADTTADAATAARSASPAAVLTVDVTGKVHHPGVYKLPGGSRVIDAVRAAGGALHGVSLDSLNLAAKLTDGQQVAVGGSATALGPGMSAAPQTEVVDLNAATVEQLQTLPGIGPVLAQHIVDYRTQHGPFPSVDALRQVSGIGPSKFAQLKDHISA